MNKCRSCWHRADSLSYLHLHSALWFGDFSVIVLLLPIPILFLLSIYSTDTLVPSGLGRLFITSGDRDI